MANVPKQAGQPRAEPWNDRPMSLDEWAALPEDSAGEIVDGMLVEEEDVGALHEVIVSKLSSVLWQWVEPRGGFVLTSDAKYAVSATRGRKPDLSVFFRGREKPPAHGAIDARPDIAIEVVSPTLPDQRRDRVEKPQEYAAFGVRWYWIVDPQLLSIEIRELLEGARYVDALTVVNGVITNVPGCDGLTLDVDALWALRGYFDAAERPEE